MKRNAQVRLLMVLQLVAVMSLIFVGTSFAADAISLQASEPYTMYYTTNGTTPAAPEGGTSTTSPATPTTYTNYYVAEGTNITPPTAVPASETISLAPNAGKGTPYVKPHKLKMHESKKEFEKYVKEKHGKRFKVEDFSRINQTDNGPDGYIDIVENKNPDILQLGDSCTESERARRVAIAKDFMVGNPKLIGVTENEELRVRSIFRENCEDFYFDRYVNGYEFVGLTIHFVFVPQFNYSVGTNLKPITPEMYAATQADALAPEEIAKIVYRDLNIPVDGKNSKQPPKLEMRKYLRNREPYVYWKVDCENVYEINAITGEILFKRPNVVF